MRTREEIETLVLKNIRLYEKADAKEIATRLKLDLIIELLLDIRDLLANQK